MLLVWYITFLVTHGIASAQLASKGVSLRLAGNDYFVSPYSVGNASVSAATLSTIPGILGLKPVTVIQQQCSVSEISFITTKWLQEDDVISQAFLQAVFIPGVESNTTSQSSSFVVSDIDSDIPSGPYFVDVNTGFFYPVYRLYDDFAGSFTASLLQTPAGTFEPLSGQISTTATLTIGVPSRLYFTPTDSKPLAGVRIAVKDIFDLAGVKTSNGNRAFYNTYPAANTTGTAMQRLIDAGAIVIGHQKPSQFANGEQATADWVDYHSPFNPRGDGYQDPSSSSSGAGASMASYPWLDLAVGSDTGGSIRGPSQVQGLFGLRPSHGLVSLDRAMPLATALDTVGFLARDPALLDTANTVLYGSNYTSFTSGQYPKQILTYNFPVNASTRAAGLLLNFTNSLAAFLGANVTTVNLTSVWSANPPRSAQNVSLASYLNTTYPTIIAQDQTNLVRDPFYADYAALHDGRLPFVDPAPLARWAYGDSLPRSALAEQIARKNTFMTWFNGILPPTNDERCSQSLFLYAGGQGQQNTRNRYISPPTVPFGFSAGRISVFAEVPDMVFPLGQVASFSNVTRHDEFFPVSVDIMAAKGCDGLLVRLAKDLAGAGVIPLPETGATIYGGDILMKREAGTRVRYIG